MVDQVWGLSPYRKFKLVGTQGFGFLEYLSIYLYPKKLL